MMTRGVVGAVVDVHLAVVPGVAGRAVAGVVAEPRLPALPAVLARVRVALVDLLGAGGPSVAPRAVADEPRDVVLAGAAHARVVPALVNIRLAPLAVPASDAPALVVVDPVGALAAVEAGTAG